MLEWKVMEIWHEPDRFTWDTGEPSLVQLAEMKDLGVSSRLGRFVKFIASHGYNGLNIWGEPDYAPEAYAGANRYLREHGMFLILRRAWHEVLRGTNWRPTPDETTPGILEVPEAAQWPTERQPGPLRTSRRLCPYTSETKEYWEYRVARDAEVMPELGGYRVNATDWYYGYGGPWHCDCPTCAAKTRRERALAGINLLGEIMARHQMTLFWETCTDDPDGQRDEVELFQGLTGEVPANVFIVIKEFYWDYHACWPEHPLYEMIATDESGRSPYITSIQPQNEYHGMGQVVCSEVERLGASFQRIKETGQQGIWVMGLVRADEPWDHPLNILNWYAIDRYAEDPDADPEAVTRDWATETFGVQAAPTVIEVINKASTANMNICHFRGGWLNYHCRMAGLKYLDSRLCGPYRTNERIAGMMGMGLPTDMYGPTRAAEIEADPALQLAFGKLPITAELKAELLQQLQQAVNLLNESISLWQGLNGEVAADVYDGVLASLEGRRNDAIFWRVQMAMYMDYKLGKLTEARIDELLEECRGLAGTWVKDPMATEVTDPEPWADGTTPAGFAEQLRAELRDPQLERFWQSLPRYEGMGVGPDPDLA